MASHIYPRAITNLMLGRIDLLADTIKVALIDTGQYTYGTNHETYDDLVGIVGTPGTLSGKTVGEVGVGVFDASDLVFDQLTGNSVEAAVVYVDGEVKYLLCYLEGTSTSLNGGQFTIRWDPGGIFQLGEA